MNPLETIQSCPICSDTQFSTYLTCEDYLVSHNKFTIQSCSTCGFRLTNPRPDESQIGNYYKSADYISHNDSGGGVIGAIYGKVRSYTLRSKLSLLNSLVKEKGKLLDIGCGTGSFAEVCQRDGWQVTGMEPDPDARKIAEEKLQAPVAVNLKGVQTDKYDIITMWHVLEHVAKLKETIKQLYELLDDKGTLIIAVPNSDSYDAALFQEYWAAYDVPRHLYHFTPSTIRQLFSKNGFELIEQKPMVFDAFYISMLSTKYQSGKTDYLKSITTGLKSNYQARQTGNWSSLIYLFKKSI